MKPATATILLLFIFIVTLSACNPSQLPCHTGLKEVEEFDHDRLFDTTGKEQGQSEYRPVKFEVYYPSYCTDRDSSVTFGDFLNMYDRRFNFNRPKDSSRKSSIDFARMIGKYLRIDTPEKLLNVATGIYKDLPLPEKKYPLIIYAAGMNGGSWENSVLFDSLAKAGYVVASVYSVGKYPGYMTDPADLDEQVRDIMFVKRKMKSMPFIDHNKIGLLSWSMGGSAATKAAMLSNDFKCLLSFDGTEIHYYGRDSSWDRQFDEIKTIPPFIPERISIPYMYIGSARNWKNDSVYIFAQHIHSEEKFYLEMKGAEHESFSSLFPIAKAAQPGVVINDSNHHERVPVLTRTFFDQYLLNRKDVSTKDTISKLTSSEPWLFSKEYPAQKYSKK